MLFVGRTRYRLPLVAEPRAQVRRARASELDLRVLASAAPGSPTATATFTLVPPLAAALDGAALLARAAVARRARCCARSGPTPSSARAPYEAAAALVARRSRACRRGSSSRCTATGARRRGSTARRRAPAARPARRRASPAAALRRADAVRTVSPFTTRARARARRRAGRDFPAYMDLEPFLVEPPRRCPSSRRRSSSACSSATRTSTGSPTAWRLAAPRVPGASLRIVGSGTPRRTSPRRSSRDCRRALGSPSSRPPRSPRRSTTPWLLVLPSRSEGMGRVLVEAFCRGRGVVGTRAGGDPRPRRGRRERRSSSRPATPPRSPTRSSRVLSDRALARAARRRARAAAAAPWLQTPEEYAQRMRELVAMRIVFVTQAADPAHPVLGATLAKIRALAARVDEVVVIADTVDARRCPRTAACGASPHRRRRRAARATSRRSRPSSCATPVAVVAHMSPIFALLAAPLAKPLRVPLLLWFTQQAAGPSLAGARCASSTGVLTVDERSVPLHSAKVRAIGHGIDVAALPVRAPSGGRRCAACSGSAATRRSRAGRPCCARCPSCRTRRSALHGPMLDRRRPRTSAAARGARAASSASTSASRSAARSRTREVPQLFGLADAVVNATRGNAADKVVLRGGRRVPAASSPPRRCSTRCCPTRCASTATTRARSPSAIRGYERRRRARAARARRGGALGRALGRARARGGGRVKPRVLFVSRERFRLPLDGAQKRKWDAVAAVVDHRVLAAAPEGGPTRDERFRLVAPARPRVLDGALFYLLLPLRIARELRRLPPAGGARAGRARARGLPRRAARSRASTRRRSSTCRATGTRRRGCTARRSAGCSTR